MDLFLQSIIDMNVHARQGSMRLDRDMEIFLKQYKEKASQPMYAQILQKLKRLRKEKLKEKSSIIENISDWFFSLFEP